MTRRPFIFVCGLHRSGTSLLHRLLRGQPEISGFAATGVPQDEGQHLQTVYPPGKAFGGPGRFGFNPASHLDEGSPLVTEANRERLWEQWGGYLDGSKQYFVEKSPPNLVRTRFLQGLFPDAWFMVITRHPVAVAFATARLIRDPDLEQLLEHWLISHERFEKDRAGLERVSLVSFESLVQYPNRVMGELLTPLGLEYQPIEETIATHTNRKYFLLWRALPVDERRVLMERFEARLQPFGYSLDRLTATGRVSCAKKA